MAESKMPARIAVGQHTGWAAIHTAKMKGDTVYYRADLVEPLVEALRDILPFIPKSSAAEGGPNARSANVAAADKVRAALSSWEAAR